MDRDFIAVLAIMQGSRIVDGGPRFGRNSCRRDRSVGDAIPAVAELRPRASSAQFPMTRSC
ncbi:hypothetical protein TIFTF001_011439 [Ficus carica]|uniref:Uncharacterized protein n=1 Tax=Ficus carica TaxID=3494 RepID=A0AA87ZRS2_FICCA|nr:hypothetical protein TIFTF001_011439 [Ficus carica]